MKRVKESTNPFIGRPIEGTALTVTMYEIIEIAIPGIVPKNRSRDRRFFIASHSLTRLL
jgi:hypothetical protein